MSKYAGWSLVDGFCFGILAVSGPTMSLFIDIFFRIALFILPLSPSTDL